MFDFRYHALSLAAIFIALVVGLVLGVAIGDKELVSSARDDLRKSLRRDVIKASHQRDDAIAALRREQEFGGKAYPILTADRLAGRRIGLVMLGDAGDMPDRIGDALKPTGATLKVVAVVRGSVDSGEIANRARATRYAAIDREPDLITDFGTRVGVQMVQGGKLIGIERTALLRSLSGSFGGLDGVIVVRNANMPDDKQAADRLAAMQDGIVRGLVGADVPVVGVETRDQNPSQVRWFRDRDTSTVDNVDEQAGRAALVFVLAGAEGAWGRKDTAQGLLPPVVGH
jgi:hypothetical protein